MKRDKNKKKGSLISRLSKKLSFLISFVAHMTFVLILAIFVIQTTKVPDDPEITITIPPKAIEKKNSAAAAAMKSTSETAKKASKNPDKISPNPLKRRVLKTQLSKDKIIKNQTEAVQVMENIKTSVKSVHKAKPLVKMNRISGLGRDNNARGTTIGGTGTGEDPGNGLRELIGDGLTTDRVDMRVTLSWTNENDVDLKIITPRGDLYFGQRQVYTGLLENDREGIIFEDDQKSNRRFENAFWVYDTAPEGRYEVYASIYDFRLLNDKKETAFSIDIVGQSKKYQVKGNLDADYGESSFVKLAEFDYKGGDILNFSTTYSKKVTDELPILKDIIIQLDISSYWNDLINLVA